MIFRRIFKTPWSLGSLLKSAYFNFHYLPFKQAIHMPILFRKPKFGELKGNVKICCTGGVKWGMVRLGAWNVSLFPDSGFVFENHGGTVVFNGHCSIGSNSAVSIGKTGLLVLGNGFGATTTLRLACYSSIKIGDNVSFGWDCILMDTDFHKMKKLESGYTRGFGPIEIGKCCWIGTRCLILKNTHLPAYTTLSAGTRISMPVEGNGYFIVGQKNKVEILREGLYRNHAQGDDVIHYEKKEQC